MLATMAQALALPSLDLYFHIFVGLFFLQQLILLSPAYNGMQKYISQHVLTKLLKCLCLHFLRLKLLVSATFL